MTSTYISHDFSTVHISKDFSLRNQSGKNVDVQRGTVCQKIPLIGEKSRCECSSPDTADHPSDTPRLLLLPYLVRQFSDMIEEKQIAIENRKADKVQRTKPKKQRAEDISQKLTSLFLGDPCRTACSVGLTTRSSVAGGL